MVTPYEKLTQLPRGVKVYMVSKPRYLKTWYPNWLGKYLFKRAYNNGRIVLDIVYPSPTRQQLPINQGDQK